MTPNFYLQIQTRRSKGGREEVLQYYDRKPEIIINFVEKIKYDKK